MRNHPRNWAWAAASRSAARCPTHSKSASRTTSVEPATLETAMLTTGTRSREPRRMRAQTRSPELPTSKTRGFSNAVRRLRTLPSER
eukprot:5190063-Pyramimonas_sp.AAC.1